VALIIEGVTRPEDTGAGDEYIHDILSYGHSIDFL